MVFWADIEPGKDELMGWPVSMHFDMQTDKGFHLHKTAKLSRTGNLEL